jgi:steroid delta-isomerase-like uncharacterized protein
MSIEENKALIRRLTQAQDAGDLAALDGLYAPDVVGHGGPPGIPEGLAGVKQFIAMLRAAFPDARTAVEDLVAEGDRVATRWTGTGTNSGSFMGLPPSGKRTTVTGIDIYRIADGKVVEHWSEWDALGLMQQLGVIPPSGHAT